MKIKIVLVLIVLAVILLNYQTSLAQEHVTGVIGNGAVVSANSSFKMTGTMGQPLIGRMSNDETIVQSGFWSTVFDLVTSVQNITDELLPAEFQLQQNYPNPFNPSTTIGFSVPQASKVMLRIYDILGRRVATLVDEEYQPGTYKVTFEAGNLATGVYIYRMQAGDFEETRKLMLLK